MAQLSQIEISCARVVGRDNLQIWLTHDLMVLQLPPLGGSTVAIDVGDDNGLEGGVMIAGEAQVEEVSE